MTPGIAAALRALLVAACVAGGAIPADPAGSLVTEVAGGETAAPPAAAAPFDSLAWTSAMMEGLRHAEAARHGEAIAAFERALGLVVPPAGNEAFVAAAANNLGRACAEAHRPGDAERHLRAALAAAEAVGGSDSEAVVVALHNLCALLAAEGRDDDAEDLLDDRDLSPLELARRLAATPAFADPAGTSLYLLAPAARTAIRRVLYATDRRPHLQPQPSDYFSGQRGDLQFGVATISLPLEGRIGQLAKPSWYKLEWGYDPERHVTLLDVAPKEQEPFVAELRRLLTAAPRRDVLLFIHGFNESMEGAARIMAQMTWDLGYDGVPVVYSWPSTTSLSTAGYLADRQNAEWTVPHLAATLRLLAGEAERAGGSLSVVAHSLGNQPMLAALELLAQEEAMAAAAAGGVIAATGANGADQGAAVGGAERAGRVPPRHPEARVPCREVIMVAPDLDADVFRWRVARAAPVARRMTLYVSANDRALQYSSDLHADLPRAGDSRHGILVLEGVDTIEVSEIDASLLGHQYYRRSRSILSDVYYLVTTGAGPERRHGLVPMREAGGRYWKFRP